jgi:3-methyladenine DNA glycosylase AlkD
MRAWSRDGDRWRRRTSIICQVGARRRLDPVLLSDCIEANLGDPDFFIRKAIGWALRQHARVEPDWVRAFVATDPALSPRSRKEALRHLG